MSRARHAESGLDRNRIKLFPILFPSRRSFVPCSRQSPAPNPRLIPPTPDLISPSPRLVKPTPGLVKRTPGLIPPNPGLIPPTSRCVKPSPGLIQSKPGLIRSSSAVLSPKSAINGPGLPLFATTFFALQAYLQTFAQSISAPPNHRRAPHFAIRNPHLN